MDIKKHQLAHGGRTITFTTGAVADQVVISDGKRVEHATLEAGRAFYRGLQANGWAPPVEEAERAMQRAEAEADRAQTRREEAGKRTARSRMERMATAMKGVG